MIDSHTLGKQPISDAAPCGHDARNSEAFDMLQTEIGKMSNPATSGIPDWPRVAELSASILTRQSKDLVAACYLSVALLHTRALPGLADGTRIIADLLACYWDTMFPPLQRRRARHNALQWMIEQIRLQGELADWSSLPPQDPELISDLRSSLERIDVLLSEKDADAPTMRPLMTLISRIALHDVVPDDVADDAPDTASSDRVQAHAEKPAVRGNQGKQGTSSPVAVAIQAGDSRHEIEDAVDGALERLAQAALWFAGNAPYDPLGFRLRRIAAWSAIEQMPTADQGRTAIVEPIQQQQVMLDALLAQVSSTLPGTTTAASSDASPTPSSNAPTGALPSASPHADLIAFAEAQLPTCPFWFDLNHAAARTLDALGETGAAACREVRNETTRFIERFPGIEQCRFSSGMPFANARTLEWLQSDTAASGAPAATQGWNHTPSDALQKAASRARALAIDHTPAEVAECLQQALQDTTSPQERLQLRILVCDLLRERHPDARLDSFAHAVVAELDRFTVDTWEPAIAVDGLRAAYEILARSEDNRVQSDALLARLTIVDTAAAMRLVN